MAERLRRAAFVDRDGVINEERGYVHRPEDFRFLARAVEGLQLLRRSGYEIVIVTNQAGIARGMYAEPDFHQLTLHMGALLAREGVRILDVKFCPHHPDGTVTSYAIECDCRKPAPGMLLQAAAEHHLDLPASALVGDKTSDVGAGRAAGVGRNVLVRSGHALPDMPSSFADFVCDDLLDAARWICGGP